MTDALRTIVFGGCCKLACGITVKNPTLLEISEYGEERYWGAIRALLCQPHDVMATLEDLGIAYEEMNPVLFFHNALSNLPDGDIGLLVELPPPGGFFPAEDKQDGSVALLHRHSEMVLRAADVAELQQALATVHCLNLSEKPNFGNSLTREFMIDRQRKRLRRAKTTVFESQLTGIVSGLVNQPGFKYDYESVQRLHISQLYDALQRHSRIANYQFTMTALYGGTLEYEKIDKAILDWIKT